MLYQVSTKCFLVIYYIFCAFCHYLSCSSVNVPISWSFQGLVFPSLHLPLLIVAMLAVIDLVFLLSHLKFARVRVFWHLFDITSTILWSSNWIVFSLCALRLAIFKELILRIPFVTWMFEFIWLQFYY